MTFVARFLENAPIEREPAQLPIEVARADTQLSRLFGAVTADRVGRRCGSLFRHLSRRGSDVIDLAQGMSLF